MLEKKWVYKNIICQVFINFKKAWDSVKKNSIYRYFRVCIPEIYFDKKYVKKKERERHLPVY